MYSVIINPLSDTKILTTSSEGRALVNKYAASIHIRNQRGGTLTLGQCEEPQEGTKKSYTVDGEVQSGKQCLSEKKIYTVHECTSPANKVQIEFHRNYRDALVDVRKKIAEIVKGLAGVSPESVGRLTATELTAFIQHRNNLSSPLTTAAAREATIVALQYFATNSFGTNVGEKCTIALVSITQLNEDCAGVLDALYLQPLEVQKAGAATADDLLIRLLNSESTSADISVFEDDTLYDTLKRLVSSPKEHPDIDKLPRVAKKLKSHINYIHHLFQKVAEAEAQLTIESNHSEILSTLRGAIITQNPESMIDFINSGNVTPPETKEDIGVAIQAAKAKLSGMTSPHGHFVVDPKIATRQRVATLKATRDNAPSAASLARKSSIREQSKKLTKNYTANNLTLAKYINNSNSTYHMDTTAYILKYCGELAPLYKVSDVEFYIEVLNSRPPTTGDGATTVAPLVATVESLRLINPSWIGDLEYKIILQLKIQHMYSDELNTAHDRVLDRIKNKKRRLLEQTKVYSTRIRQFTEICTDIQRLHPESPRRFMAASPQSLIK